MAITNVRLRVLCFPQSWDGQELSVRVLVAPFGNPLLPLEVGLKPFAQANLSLSAQLSSAIDKLPDPATIAERLTLDAATPANLQGTYTALAADLQIDPSAPAPYKPPTKTQFLKMLMPSYLKAAGVSAPRTEFAVTDNRYVCALIDGPRPKRTPTPKTPPRWDSVLAMALRQPLLAEALGLIYAARVRPADPLLFSEGGWLYVTLGQQSDYFAEFAIPDFALIYAARIPRLTPGVSAPLFAPVLFPVSTTSPAGSYDELLQETEHYADGFARLVHAYQPERTDYLNLSRLDARRPRPHHETGLKLGWDDEQIVIWLNRQITDDPRNGKPDARNTPLGVQGFRVDVRADENAPWHSLVRMQGPIRVGASMIGDFDGEMAIELAPSQLQGERDGDYWLPPYYAQWTGASLVAADALAREISGFPPLDRVLKPVDERAVPLRYGSTYQFRVRLMDLSGGGPSPQTPDTPAGCIGVSRFRRYLPPGSVKIAEPIELPDGSLRLSIKRPTLGYPALTYTQQANATQALLADMAAARADGRPPCGPDPDVQRLRIDVRVASLEADSKNDAEPTPQQRLYTAFRDFDPNIAEPLELRVEFYDSIDLEDFPAPADAGSLVLPSARTVHVSFMALARRDPAMPAATADPIAAEMLDIDALPDEEPSLHYYGSHVARVGASHTVTLRREALDERELWAEAAAAPFQGLFLQPSPVHDAQLTHTNAAVGSQEQAPESAMQRLARRLRLQQRDLTLRAPVGRRVVFGASDAVRHVLSPDHSTITFANETEITAQWLIAVPLRLARDWTWDGLTDEGVAIFRHVNGAADELAGYVSPRRTLSGSAVQRGVPLERASTDLVFFDAIDPKPDPGRFPTELEVSYRAVPRFRVAPAQVPADWSEALRLPMAAAPTQVPRIASAGIALSGYVRDQLYSQTAVRQRALWIEFAEPVTNPHDAYFARVTMHAADPMLTAGEPAPPPGPLEPPLDIDPEPIRAIVAGQPEDSSGLSAMQRLIPADGDGPIRHFLLPLPPALSEVSPELFGFFTYELRVGHAQGWSTAQARFGLAQRLTGVQHPAPTLKCSLARTREHICVSAPFATPVTGGRWVGKEPPASQLWALLYAQAQLADGSDWRNILIGRTQLQFPENAHRRRAGFEPHGVGYWDHYEIENWLEVLGLPANAPLSALAIELLPEPDAVFVDPLGKDLGQVRVLRTSPLTPVPAICLDTEPS
ncbi:hypothetical protein [Aromatoleum buckelii]|uniref:Uncharacterized protein n=1 Tax=Aromatoleum buckelii TaxID=200254 RepID=A0ABX1N3U1_9RHOO|nr:hypothetical protein [Aromatoleum buckelii]MCK0511470.1 hypothetical protein [Aromatoleum buckelii]